MTAPATTTTCDADAAAALRRARRLALAVVAAALAVKVHTDLGEPRQAAAAVADTLDALAAVQPCLRDAATMQEAACAHQLQVAQLAERARRARRIARAGQAMQAGSEVFQPHRPPGRPPHLGPWL